VFGALGLRVVEEASVTIVGHVGYVGLEVLDACRNVPLLLEYFNDKRGRILLFKYFRDLRIEAHGPELVAPHVIRHAVKLHPQGYRAALP
jgi:hypothetical protein